MAHLKLYLNGTPGGTDGEELTDSTVIKGIMTNSQASRYTYGGKDTYYGASVLPVCLRCDAGFKATNVILKSITNTYALLGYINSTMYFAIENLDTFKSVCETSSFGIGTIQSTMTFNVGNTNVMLILVIEAASTDTTNLVDLFSVSYVEDETA